MSGQESTAPAPKAAGRAGMLRRTQRLALVAMFSIVVAITGLLLKEHGLLWIKDLDDNFGDLRTALLSERAEKQRQDIVILLVTEDTLFGYPARSPVDRGLLADLVTAIDSADPAAIGLDFIFDRRTAQDGDLLNALRKAHSPVVLGAIDRRLAPQFQPALLTTFNEGLDVQEAFLKAAGKPVGQIFFEQDTGRLTLSDQAVRRIGRAFEGSAPRSFGELLAAAAKPSATAPPNPTIAWMLPPASPNSRLFLTLALKRPDGAQARPAARDLLPAGWQNSIRNKIVLIGAEMFDADLHVTPLTIRDGLRTPGVMIHAQIVAQILDGRSVWEPIWWKKLFIVAIVCAICFTIGRRLRAERWLEILYQGAGLGLVWIATLLAFAQLGALLPSGPMLFAWAAGALGGNRSAIVFRWLDIEKWLIAEKDGSRSREPALQHVVQKGLFAFCAV